MKSVNSWILTNNRLHQLFKDNNEFISIKVRGNTWEPITRWLKLDSRIFKETTSKARITQTFVFAASPWVFGQSSLSQRRRGTRIDGNDSYQVSGPS